MKTEQSILETLRDEETPYWYLYDGASITARSGETSDIEESLLRLKESLAQLPPGTYRLKAANHRKKHNGATWHDVTISARKGQPQPTAMNGQSTNAYGIPDHIYLKIQEEAKQSFMFQEMYAEFKEFRKEWPDFKKRFEKMEKFLTEDSDGDGISDFAETMGSVAKAADSASTVKKVFTGTGLFD